MTPKPPRIITLDIGKLDQGPHWLSPEGRAIARAKLLAGRPSATATPPAAATSPDSPPPFALPLKPQP